jgi:hypothetical protein
LVQRNAASGALAELISESSTCLKSLGRQFDLPPGSISKSAPTRRFDLRTLTLTKFKLCKIDVRGSMTCETREGREAGNRATREALPEYAV